MAQSRLERIGTIYTRTQSLLRGGAMKPEDKPMWYVIYQAFPPKVEPRFDREVPLTPIRKIFYKEDLVRAKFQKSHNFLATNLFNAKSQSPTQRFLSIYKEMEKSGTPEDELYSKALEAYQTQLEAYRQTTKETVETERNTKKENEGLPIDLRKLFED